MEKVKLSGFNERRPLLSVSSSSTEGEVEASIPVDKYV